MSQFKSIVDEIERLHSASTKIPQSKYEFQALRGSIMAEVSDLMTRGNKLREKAKTLNDLLGNPVPTISTDLKRLHAQKTMLAAIQFAAVSNLTDEEFENLLTHAQSLFNQTKLFVRLNPSEVPQL